MSTTEEPLENNVDSLDFDFGAKKKKKKKKDEEATTEAPKEEIEVAAPAPKDDASLDDLADFDLSKKKKKKAKEPEAEKPAAEAEEAFSEDFDLKKKKKKKAAMDLDAFEKELGEDAEEGAGDATGKSDQNRDDDNSISFGGSSEPEPWAESDREYTYQELLDRAFRIIRQANPEMDGGKKRYVMIPPQVVREGTKKTLFANFPEICKRMHRQPDHVITYLFSELGTTGSVDGSQRLIIKGRFQPSHIENVLKGYILEYVTCKICRSPDTILTKENRLTFIQCQSCGAKRSVANIKSGFSAQVDRRNK